MPEPWQAHRPVVADHNIGFRRELSESEALRPLEIECDAALDAVDGAEALRHSTCRMLLATCVDMSAACWIFYTDLPTPFVRVPLQKASRYQ